MEQSSSNSSYCQNQNNVAKFDEAIIIVSRPKSYQDDDYSF